MTQYGYASNVAAGLATADQIRALEAASRHVAAGGGGGTSDHGALTGLADDDHPQYTTDAEATAIANGLIATHAALPGADAAAIHDNVAGEIAAIAEKATPIAADMLIIEDSADANAKKMVQIGNLPAVTLAETTYGLRFAAGTTEEGQDQNATGGSNYTTIWGNMGIIKAMRLTEVKVDLKAGTYNLWIDQVDQGQVILGGDTADASFALATPVVLTQGLHRFQLVRSATGVWYYRNGVYSGTIWYEDTMTFGAAVLTGTYSIPMKLIAFLGTWEVVS